ncbi:MAG: retropepsin-like domain-containing protein [Candidatus Riflebacteria bacterium]|nr:retropepsin-like domain-containing protein [Candidatus Riflebacteria bacterium]
MQRCKFALDPGATITLVKPGIVDTLGYSPRTGDKISSITSAVGMELGYLRRVQKFEALGFEHEDFLVNASDLPPKAGIDGLLGLNFLHNYNYEVRSKEGLIKIEPT